MMSRPMNSTILHSYTITKHENNSFESPNFVSFRAHHKLYIDAHKTKTFDKSLLNPAAVNTCTVTQSSSIYNS